MAMYYNFQNNRQFNDVLQELNATDGNYKDLLRLLYINAKRNASRPLQCSSMLSTNSCKGHCLIGITV